MPDREDRTDADTESDEFSLDDWDTLELTLEEARRRYDNEEARRDSVESKIGTVVTVDALIISFGGLFSDLHVFLILVVTFPAVVSAGLGLYGIRSRKYGKPGYDIVDFHEYQDMQETQQREQFLLAYEVTTDDNAVINSKKFSIFNYCIGYTFLSLILAMVAPLLSNLGFDQWINTLSFCQLVTFGTIIYIGILAVPMAGIWLTLERSEKENSS